MRIPTFSGQGPAEIPSGPPLQNPRAIHPAQTNATANREAPPNSGGGAARLHGCGRFPLNIFNKTVASPVSVYGARLIPSDGGFRPGTPMVHPNDTISQKLTRFHTFSTIFIPEIDDSI